MTAPTAPQQCPVRFFSGNDLRWAAHATASVFVASIVGQLASASSIRTWYPTIAKPWFTPPNWVFPIAWTLLFTAMGTAFWRILRRPPETRGRSAGIALFLLQLVFNAGWSVAFFGMHSPLYGLVVIAPFWLLILGTTLVFRAMDRLASWLLVPYLAWVSFAALLNAVILQMN